MIQTSFEGQNSLKKLKETIQIRLVLKCHTKFLTFNEQIDYQICIIGSLVSSERRGSVKSNTMLRDREKIITSPIPARNNTKNTTQMIKKKYHVNLFLFINRTCSLRPNIVVRCFQMYLFCVCYTETFPGYCVFDKFNNGLCVALCLS